jgi:hypothetical protein
MDGLQRVHIRSMGQVAVDTETGDLLIYPPDDGEADPIVVHFATASIQVAVISTVLDALRCKVDSVVREVEL